MLDSTFSDFQIKAQVDLSMADLYEETEVSLSRKVETSIWAAKLVLLCVGFVTTLIFFKVALLPYVFNLLLSTLPPLWISLRSWLSPPYIYIILNFIIIFIAASSKQSKSNSPNTFKNTSTTTNPLWQDVRQQQQQRELNPSFSVDEQSIDKPLKETSDSDQTKLGNMTGEGEEEEGEEKEEDGKGEGEEGNEEEVEETLDTLEDTWKLITEGKGKMVKPELKKSETWDTSPRVVVSKEEEEENGSNDPVVWARREMRKYDTFNDRVTLIKREIIQKSMTQDELTQRVEAFINCFNEDMRLQRQESEQLFMEIINRGV